MTCLLCSATTDAATLVRISDDTAVAHVCESCQHELTDRALHSQTTCNHCDREANYALQPEGGPLVETDAAGSGGVVLSTEQFGVFCDQHFERHE